MKIFSDGPIFWSIYQKFAYVGKIIIIIIRIDRKLQPCTYINAEQAYKTFGVYIVAAVGQVGGQIVVGAGYSVELLDVIKRGEGYFYGFHFYTFFRFIWQRERYPECHVVFSVIMISLKFFKSRKN